MTIDASGNDPTPDQNNGDGSRVFNVSDGSDATQIDVTFIGLTLTGADIGSSGGAVRSLENLWIGFSSISGNSAGEGGAVWCDISGAGTMVIGDSTIADNSASFGAGVFLSMRDSAIANITRCSIARNAASDRGGGIWADARNSGSLGIQFSLISGNSADRGGGWYARTYGTSRLAISESAVVDNSASNTGGGMHVDAHYASIISINSTQISRNGADGNPGGGAYLRTFVASSVTITNSTIAENHSSSVGGGILAESSGSGGFAIRHSTISGNSANIGGGIYANGTVPLDLDHTLVADNSDVAGTGPDIGRSPSAPTINATFTLIGNTAGSGVAEAPVGSSDVNGNLIGGAMYGIIDPMLGPLADNGGLELPDGSHILTYALKANSPALDAGDPAAVAGVDGVPEFDQRGNPFTRVYDVDGVGGSRIDIGAYEAAPFTLVVDTLTDENDGDYSFHDFSLREAIDFANTHAGHDTINFSPDLTSVGPATIVLTMGELAINDAMAIDGPGAELLTIDASGNNLNPVVFGDGSRVFNVDNGSSSVVLDVAIRGLALTGGDANQYGGAILSRERLVAENLVVLQQSSHARRGDRTIWSRRGSERRSLHDRRQQGKFAGWSVLCAGRHVGRDLDSRQHDFGQHCQPRRRAVCRAIAAGCVANSHGQRHGRQFRRAAGWCDLPGRYSRVQDNDSQQHDLRQHVRSTRRWTVHHWRPRLGDRRQYYRR